MTVRLLPPSEYPGELLCARCGQGQTTGNYYLICADPGPQTHAESCAIYDYGDMFVCPRCRGGSHGMRPTIHQVLLEAAETFAQRSTCSRLNVGAVIAKDSRIISTGYNGVPAGLPHCEHDGTEESCGKAVHAEANAIAFAARNGISTEGATLYVTHSPCLDCAKLIINAGISTVYYRTPYRTQDGIELLSKVGIYAAAHM